MSNAKKRLVVLISGGGTNLQAIIDACQQQSIEGEIVAVVSNKADAFGLQRAAQAGIAQCVINHRDYENREAFDAALLELVLQQQPDLVILAGFMRILTPVFVNPLLGKMLNIHPSLLPKFTGLHTHQRAIDAGEERAGTTVHFVTAELDGGPAVIQASVPILADDDADLLAARVLQQEHIIFPQAVRWFCENRLQFKDDKAWLDDKLLPETGYRLDS